MARKAEQYRAFRRNYVLRNPDPDVRHGRRVALRNAVRKLFGSLVPEAPKGDPRWR